MEIRAFFQGGEGLPCPCSLSNQTRESIDSSLMLALPLRSLRNFRNLRSFPKLCNPFFWQKFIQLAGVGFPDHFFKIFKPSLFSLSFIDQCMWPLFIIVRSIFPLAVPAWRQPWEGRFLLNITYLCINIYLYNIISKLIVRTGLHFFLATDPSSARSPPTRPDPVSFG